MTPTTIQDDDNGSYASSEDSDYDPNEASTSHHSDTSDRGFNPNLPVPQPVEIAGVDDTADTNNGDGATLEAPNDNLPGVDDTLQRVDPPEELDEDIPGVDPPQVTNLEAYVDELAAELDDEIAGLDSHYNPASDTNDSDVKIKATINENEADAIRTDATCEQTSADNDLNQDDLSDNKESEEEDKENDASLTRLRRNRIPTYGHLKGCDGDGPLPTIARPDKFQGGGHQSHVILQNIVMTQYNLKQGIKKFGDPGKAAVLTELRQLYDRHVISPVNKYDLTGEERKGALCYLMFLKEK
jgi:hypothetical protein